MAISVPYPKRKPQFICLFKKMRWKLKANKKMQSSLLSKYLSGTNFSCTMMKV